MILSFKKTSITAAAVLICSILIITASAYYPSVAASSDKEELCLPVIMYHGLTESSSRRNKYMIPPDYFENDLKFLKANGYHTIFISELTAHFKNGKPLPEKPIILTFDDGYYDNYVYAFPLLQKYQMKAVISPIGAAADRAAEEEYRSVLWSQCTWEELKEMTDSGLVEIQNHTYNLHRFGSGERGASRKSGETDKEYIVRLTEDLTTANERIQTKTGTKPCAVIYPFGAKGNLTEETVRSLGFEASFDCEEKINRISSAYELFGLHRFLRPDTGSSEDFFAHVLNTES